jgi:hypothetical protein
MATCEGVREGATACSMVPAVDRGLSMYLLARRVRQEPRGRVSRLLSSSVVVVLVMSCARGLCRRAAVFRSSLAIVGEVCGGEGRAEYRRDGVDAAWAVK